MPLPAPVSAPSSARWVQSVSRSRSSPSSAPSLANGPATTTSGAPGRPTCAITSLAQTRPFRQSTVCARHTGEARRAPCSSRCTNSFAKTAASSKGFWRRFALARGRSSAWRAVPPARSLARRPAARPAIPRYFERLKRLPSACRASDACGERHRLWSGSAGARSSESCRTGSGRGPAVGGH